MLGILAALFHQGRKIEFNLCVNLAFGDFLFAWQNRFLWPSTSLFHESCWLTLSWNLSFWSFWFSLPKLSLLLLIVKSDFKHIYFCWVFIHWVVSIRKSVWFPILQSQVSVLLRAFFEKTFLLVTFEENLLKILVLLSWTCFSFGFLLVKWKCFMFVLELVFSV